MTTTMMRRLVPALAVAVFALCTMLILPPPADVSLPQAAPTPSATAPTSQTPPVTTPARCYDVPQKLPAFYYANLGGKETPHAFGPPAPKHTQPGEVRGAYTVWRNPQAQTDELWQRLCGRSNNATTVGGDWALLSALEPTATTALQVTTSGRPAWPIS